MRNGFEEIMTVDKAHRDEIFHDLRATGLPNERRCVRFSGNQPLMVGAEGEIATDDNGRAMYVSTWSVAYPKELPEQRIRNSRIYRNTKQEVA